MGEEVIVVEVVVDSGSGDGGGSEGCEGKGSSGGSGGERYWEKWWTRRRLKDEGKDIARSSTFCFSISIASFILFSFCLICLVPFLLSLSLPHFSLLRASPVVIFSFNFFSDLFFFSPCSWRRRGRR